MNDTDKGCVVFAIAAFAVIALLVGLVAWMLLSTQGRIDSFQRQCVAADGHIYNPGGISWCLTTDGRFIEVYP